MLLFPALLLLCTSAIATDQAAADELAPAIVEIKLKPARGAYQGRGNMPVVIKSAEDAAKYFEQETAGKLAKQVDFKKQVVVLFAWRGSGQDKLSYVVAESFPEQITFTLQRGRTRDLRPHAHVYAIRNNVKWNVK